MTLMKDSLTGALVELWQSIKGVHHFPDSRRGVGSIVGEMPFNQYRWDIFEEIKEYIDGIP